MAVLPDMPPTVEAFLASGRSPDWLAECFDPAQTLSERPDWTDVAETIDAHLDAAEPSIRGSLALVSAYGHLVACDLDPEEYERSHERVTDLLTLAGENGVDAGEFPPLWLFLQDCGDAAAEFECPCGDEDEEEDDDHDESACLCDCHDTPAEARFSAAYQEAFEADRAAVTADDHRRAARLHLAAADLAPDDERASRPTLNAAQSFLRAGDRGRAVPLFRAVVGNAPAGATHDVTEAWAALIASAAEHEGAEAARALWQEARGWAEWMPWPGAWGRFTERLLGRGVPDIVAEAVAIRRRRTSWPLRREDRRVMRLAVAEISAEMSAEVSVEQRAD